MKTKLLKKVRKRYVIRYYSKQVMLYNRTFNTECMLLIDTDEEYRAVKGCEIGDSHKNLFEMWATTQEEAKDKLMKLLAQWIHEDYEHTKKTTRKQKIENVWYNK